MLRRKNLFPSLLVALVLALVGVTAYYVLTPQLMPHTSLRLGDGVFSARVARTEGERQKGLSGASQLGATKAMIFVFPSDAKWPIWAKDMNYPIDVVWLDSTKKVIYIVKNMPPESYPKQFAPTNGARYVVEIKAGTVDAKSILIGKTATFDENKLEGGVSL